MKITLSQFHLPKRNNVESHIRSIATADKLVQCYPEVCLKDLGTLPGTVYPRVDENAEPSITPSRWMATALKGKFKAELDHLENLGVLAVVDECPAWVSSVVRGQVPSEYA